MAENKGIIDGKNIDDINERLGIEGEVDTSAEAIAVTSGDIDVDEYIEQTISGETPEEIKENKKKAKEKILVTAGIGKNVIKKSIDTVMHESMMPYSEHVILDRALPRVEDGLKPVQRRILYTMLELGITPDKPYRKSARIVGDCLGKYHPHGDRSVYDAMVRMAQPYNMRETLVDGHGNFGSIDGDSAAAMRYTEARMTPLAMELLRDLEKDTVTWNLNFDDTMKEPGILPSRFPNILVNGASGIAVGLATNIPTHNLGEAISGVIAYIENPDISLKEMMKIIKGPDFPTGGFIIVGDELTNAYENGRGKLILRAKINIENGEYEKKNIVIKELPYQVNKATLLQRILELRESKKDLLSGIAEICDESDRNGMRAVIRIKKDADPEAILNVLFKYSDLQVTFGVNMVAIADGRPQQMGLLDIIAYYTDYQRDVVLRRTKYDYNAAKEREHILDGLVIAVRNIDEVISIIKKSASPSEAKTKLRERFSLSDRQAQAILDMRLARLTNLEIFKLEKELEEVKALIIQLSSIIGSKKLQFETVKNEMLEIKRKYKSERASVIISGLDDYFVTSDNDSKPTDDVVIGVSVNGNIKSMPLKHFSMATRSFSEKTSYSDIYSVLFQTTTDKTVLGFSNLGNAFKIDVSSIPDGKWREKGTPLNEVSKDAAPNERLVAIFELTDTIPNGDLLFFTKAGMIKKTSWKDYSVIKSFYQAGKFKDEDEVIAVQNDLPDTTILFVTKKGMTLNAEKTDIPVQGRISGGVKGINLYDGDSVVLATQVKKKDVVALISDKGFAKRVDVSEIEVMARYRKGVKIFDFKGDNGKKLVYAAVEDSLSRDVIFEDKDNLYTCYCTADFAKENRTTKGKSLSKSKAGLNIINAFKYNNSI